MIMQIFHITVSRFLWDFDFIFSKSPILSSYIIDLRNFDEKIINVKDFQFLHGYYEPTVFILFEPLQTWAG